MPLIELKDIVFTYGAPGRRDFSLKDINLSVENGEFISILGQNGSGKSTLLKIIAGLLKPERGTRALGGKDYRQYSHRNLARSIAFVPQAANTVFAFSVYETVMMGRTPYLNFLGYETPQDKQIVNEALELVEISHLKNKGINEVSGGEAQRAYIARAMVQQPEIILLDEANSHLDIKHQISIFNLIKKLNSEKRLTVIAISHDLNLAGFYSERIILMDKGNIYKDGPSADILTEENIHTVFEVASSVKGLSGDKGLTVTIYPGGESTLPPSATGN